MGFQKCLRSKWAVLSPLLFFIVMDAVCDRVMEGLLYEISFADDRLHG
jgi:hypothetical protein